MAVTPSSMIPLGTKAPSFKLLEPSSGKVLALHELQSDLATVILFICNHCPYVKHILPKLIGLVKDYQKKGVSFIAINSNDAENYPADSPEAMRTEVQQKGLPFPYLYDETQQTARAYHAACTPDLYVFDHDLKCVYRGRFDDSTPGNGKAVSGKDLSAALDSLLAGKPVSPEQQPSVGCNIKWKPK